MMQLKFYKHENVIAAGDFYETFPWNLQNLNAADIVPFLFRKFSM